MDSPYIYERVSKIHEKMGNMQMANKFAVYAYKFYVRDGDCRKASEISRTATFNYSKKT